MYWRVVVGVVGLLRIAIESILILFIATVSLLIISYASSIIYTPFTISSAGTTDALVYSAQSSLLFTGMVPTVFSELIRNSSPLSLVSPEVAVIAIAHSKPVYVRGVVFDFFRSMVSYRVVSGGDGVERGEALVGLRLAEELGVEVGSWIQIYSLFNNRSLALRVKGLITGNRVLDDELVVHIDDARYLRGFSSRFVSYIRVRSVDGGVEVVREVLNVTHTEVSRRDGRTIPSWIAGLLDQFKISSTALERYTLGGEDLMAISRYASIAGFTTALLLTLLLIFTLSAAATKTLSRTFKVMYIAGYTKWRILYTMLLTKALTIVPALTISYIASHYILSLDLVQIRLLGHGVVCGFEPLLSSLYIFSAALFYTISSLYFARRMMVEW